MKHTYEGHEVIVGVDEAGRGPLAFSVFAAAVVWDPAITAETHPLVAQIKDSKKLSKKKRDVLRTFIETHALAHCVASVDEATIDRVNILNATHMAMRKALVGCFAKRRFDLILVDGDRSIPFSDPTVPDGEDTRFITSRSVIGGDNEYLQIAAASILAKTHHDEYIHAMLEAHPELHKYDMAKNMAYGTAKHCQAILEHGPTQWHRRTFLVKLLARG